MSIRRIGALLALLVLVVAACSPGPGTGGQLEGTKWVLNSFDVDGILTIVPETVYADASFDARRVSGFSGCNQYDALYRAGRPDAARLPAGVDAHGLRRGDHGLRGPVPHAAAGEPVLHRASRHADRLRRRRRRRAPGLRRRAAEPAAGQVDGRLLRRAAEHRGRGPARHRARRRVRDRHRGRVRRLQLLQRHLRDQRHGRADLPPRHHPPGLRRGRHGAGDRVPRGAPGGRPGRIARLHAEPHRPQGRDRSSPSPDPCRRSPTRAPVPRRARRPRRRPRRHRPPSPRHHRRRPPSPRRTTPTPKPTPKPTPHTDARAPSRRRRPRRLRPRPCRRRPRASWPFPGR